MLFGLSSLLNFRIYHQFHLSVANYLLFLSLFFVSTGLSNGQPPPPTVRDDNVTVHKVGFYNIFANDDPLNGYNYEALSQFSHGTLENGGQGNFIYRPQFGYVGSDTMTYRVCYFVLMTGQTTCSNTATVTVSVVNGNPSAVADYIDVLPVPGTPFHRSEFSVFTNDTDPDNDPLGGLNITNGPSHGRIEGSGTPRFIIYTMDQAGYVGTDSFFYTIQDDWGGTSNLQSVLLTIKPNDGAENAGRSCAVGEPVNMMTGNMWLEQTDYALSGVGENIEINRFYNSTLRHTGLFGYGWSTKYDENIQIFDERMVRLNMPDGRAVYFVRINNTQPFQTDMPDFYGQLVQNADLSFTLTYKDGSVHQFAPNGKLLFQRDRQGNQTTLAYNGNDLVSITDPFGRSLQFVVTNGVVTQISDALGIKANYLYNGDGTLQSVNYADGSRFLFEYVGIGGRPYLATVKDALNNVLETHQYDSTGRAITSEKHGGVERYTFDYANMNDGANSYMFVTDALGRQTKYYFDPTRRRKLIKRIEGNCNCGSGSQTMDYFYDDKLNLIRTVDALGREATYTYDAQGNPLTVSSPTGTETFTYNQFGQVLTRTDKMGGVWTNVYDPQGKLLSTKDPLNAITTITYTPAGQVATIKDALNRTTSFGYDPQGRVGQVTDALNKTTTFAYDPRSRLLSVTNALGFVTAYEYDAADRLKKVIDPLTRTVEYGYDIAGRRISTTDQKGNMTTYSYDGAYRLVAVTNAFNHTSQIAYDLMSNVTTQTDALGNVTTYQYDAFDRLSKVIYPVAETGAASLEENFEYDLVGNLKRKVDTAGRQTLFDYDAVNRLVRSIDANNQQTLFEYNPRNQMTAVVDALNQRYEFVYDPLGRTLSQTKAGATMSYQYNAVGNRISRTDYKGVTTNYVYDALNRLRQIQYPNASENIVYTYDALSRLQNATNYAGTVDFNYTKRNQVSQVIDVHGRKVNYTYDVSGNPNLMSLDDVQQVDYQFDKVNRLQVIKNLEDNTQIDYNYDAANRLTRKILPNGIETGYQYDGMSRMTRLRDFKTNPDTTQTNLYNRQYSYDTAGNISQIKIGNQTKNYNYDLIDRLTTVTATTPTQNENYGYDAVGNRTASHLSTTYQYAAFNKLTNSQQASFVYDSNGNMVTKTDQSGTTQYVWDFENRLRQVIKPDGGTVSYKYDALGRRSGQTYGNGFSTKFTYDGEDVILDVNSDGTSVKYLNGLGIDNKISLKTNGVTSYFVQDHLGSTNALTDATGNVTSSATYDSFGNATGNIATRYQFTGREFDSFTGLYYYRARFYDSQIGRFISEDPIGLNGGINQFGYVEGNPLNFNDPMGLEKGPGSQLADSIESSVEYARQYYQVDVQHWVWNGTVNTIADLAGGFGDMFRVGEGSYCAFAAEDENIYGRLAYIAMDVSRAANLFTTLASPVAGRVGSARGTANEVTAAPCLLCFEADTEVQTKDGEKPISQISIDDKVLSYNTETGEMSYQPVQEKFTRFADDIYSLKIEGEEKALNVTSEHPFYTKVYKDGFSGEAEWKEVKDLKVDNEIKLSNGKWAKILEIKFKGKGQVYNFSVAENHNYFVGDSRLLTHNAKNCFSSKQLDELTERLRNGDDVYVNSVEEAREILDNMPDLRPGGKQNPEFKDPRGTYRGDLINKNKPSDPIHGPGVRSDHRFNPHYNILFHNKTKASIIIK